MDRTREPGIRRTLGVAVLVHAAIFGAMLLAPARIAVPKAPAPVEPEAGELAVDVESTSPAAAPATATAAAGDARVAVLDRGAGSSTVAASSSPSSISSSSSSATSLEPAPPPSPSSSSPGVTFGTMGADIGVSGTNPFLARGALPAAPGEAAPGREPTPAEQAAESKKRVQASIRASGQERDRALGLGPEGPVLGALESATSRSTAPVNGRAIFLAIANGAGEVVGISVLECDGARSEWAGAAQIALGDLKGKKLRMPSSATKAEMKIEITSAWKLPSGHDPGADVTVAGIPVHKGEGKESTKVTILDPIPKIHMTEIAPGVVVPVPVVNFTIIGTNGDPANIGASPRRVVHSHLLASNIE
jgi:hypothetical protein